jgi:hypothetical protein
MILYVKYNQMMKHIYLPLLESLKNLLSDEFIFLWGSSKQLKGIALKYTVVNYSFGIFVLLS